MLEPDVFIYKIEKKNLLIILGAILGGFIYKGPLVSSLADLSSLYLCVLCFSQQSGCKLVFIVFALGLCIEKHKKHVNKTCLNTHEKT